MGCPSLNRKIGVIEAIFVAKKMFHRFSSMLLLISKWFVLYWSEIATVVLSRDAARASIFVPNKRNIFLERAWRMRKQESNISRLLEVSCSVVDV